MKRDKQTIIKFSTLVSEQSMNLRINKILSTPKLMTRYDMKADI